MRATEVFRKIVEPSLERVAVIEVLHVERHEGRDFVISHLLRRNILTEFDARLSRHLAATRGDGFPHVTVSVRVRDRREEGAWQGAAPVDYPSIPHALCAIARRAVGRADSATLRLHYHALEEEERTAQGIRRVIDRDEVEILETALAHCQQLGEFAFLDITGDFDLIMIKPPDGSMRPIVMDLFNRRLTIPPVPGVTGGQVSAPLFEFERTIKETTDARTYLAALRNAMMQHKERAVLEFRAAAEKRILDFEYALRGRPLEDFRLEAVVALVARLKAGLGESLAGLSEDAQITAFDWALTIEAGRTQGPGSYGPDEHLLEREREREREKKKRRSAA